MEDLNQTATTVANDNNLGAYGKSLKAALELAVNEMEAKKALVNEKQGKWEMYQTSPQMFEDIYATATVETEEVIKAKRLEAKDKIVDTARNTRKRNTDTWNGMTLQQQQQAIQEGLPIAKNRKITAIK